MPNSPVALAQIRHDLAVERDRLTRAQERVSQLEQLLNLAEQVYGDDSEAAASNVVALPPAGKPGPLANIEAYDAMVIVLGKAGRKMTLPEIADEMLAMGWTTRAERPAETLRVALRRDESGRIVRAERGLYALREQVMPWESVLDGTDDEDGDDENVVLRVDPDSGEVVRLPC